MRRSAKPVLQANRPLPPPAPAPAPANTQPLQGVLNAQGCQVVARLCFYVFTPALTFSKLVQAISVSSIAHLWPLLLNMTVRWVLRRPWCDACDCGCGVTWLLWWAC